MRGKKHKPEMVGGNRPVQPDDFFAVNIVGLLEDDFSFHDDLEMGNDLRLRTPDDPGSDPVAGSEDEIAVQSAVEREMDLIELDRFLPF